MEDDQDLTITLEELQKLDSNQRTRPPNTVFAVYLSSNSSLPKRNLRQIIALDTQTIPSIPMRRIACSKCLNQNILCEDCQQCKGKSLVCCRNINCIFDLRQYIKSPDKEVYLKCPCMKKYYPSTQLFSVDWKLFNLLLKLDKIDKVKYYYYLHYQAGLLWITEEQEDKEEQRHILRTVCEDSYESQPQFCLAGGIQESNLRHLANLVKQKVKNYLNFKDRWDVSTIEEDCDSIIDRFKDHKGLKTLKLALQQEPRSTSNPFVSGHQIRSTKNIKNLEISEVLINGKQFQNLSRAVNERCLFYYHKKLNKLFVKNAIFDKKQQQIGLKAIEIINSQTSERTQGDQIWFKDRKGDIFNVQGQCIYLFKYHLREKKMKRIQLRKDPLFARIKNAQSLIYVSQVDRVYYFDSSNLKNSVYFDLHRPQKDEKQFSNCLSVHLPRPFLDWSNHIKMYSFLRATYILEPHISNHKVQVPTIYLLQQKNMYLPLPLCLLRIVHSDEKRIKPEEVISTQGQFPQKIEDFDIFQGIFTIFKRDNHSIIAILGKINQRLTLIEGRIVSHELRTTVQWNLHPISFSTLTNTRITTKIEFSLHEQTSCIQNRQDRQKRLQPEGFLSINDLDGLHTNNTSRYLAFCPSLNCFYELVLSCCEGKYSLRQFSCS